METDVLVRSLPSWRLLVGLAAACAGASLQWTVGRAPRDLALPFPVAWIGRKLKPKAPRRPPQPVKSSYSRVYSAGVTLDVVSLDAHNSQLRVTVVPARGRVGRSDDWSGIIARARPIAAVTGTYFGPASSIPVGTIVAEGRLLFAGGVGTAFAYGPKRGPRIIECSPKRPLRWQGWDTALRAGPLLLTNGKVTLWPRDEGFRDPAIFGCKRRTAVAITRDGRLLFVAVRQPVYLRTLAAALKGIGARDAMCLDGGTSAGLYYRGKTRVRPGRSLTNLLVAYETPADYRRYVQAHVPLRPIARRASKSRVRVATAGRSANSRG